MIKVSKRYSTWINLVVIILGAATPWLKEVIPVGAYPYVMMVVAMVTAVGQNIRQQPGVDSEVRKHGYLGKG